MRFVISAGGFSAPPWNREPPQNRYFAAQWLRLQDLDKIHPDARLYPQFDSTLADAMIKETELLFDSIVREDRDVLDLLTADYTFVNERLARHYGIPNISGPGFRRVSQIDANRRGLLGQGSILTMTSVADRTSPVLRGKWVLEVLIGMPPPPPPRTCPISRRPRRRTDRSCCRSASAWKSTARTRSASPATA